MADDNQASKEAPTCVCDSGCLLISASYANRRLFMMRSTERACVTFDDPETLIGCDRQFGICLVISQHT